MRTSYKKPHPALLEDVWITSGIFSNHYLLERLPQAGQNIWPSDEAVLPLYKAIQELYEKNIVGLRKGNEANTERRFIDKVFNELGFGYLNQDKIPEAEHRQVPDYFLYSTSADADKAFKLSPHKKYKLAISIAESKRWDHNLDQPSSGKGKAAKGRYTHQQIRDYLNESEHIKWGILTNAKEWRLYSKEGRSSKFFEIDLEACLKDLRKFKYFYLLFSPNAFVKESSGRCLLDSIFDESLRFQEDVEKDLREKVFKCVEWLGHGFLFREENRLSEKDLESIYHHSLILLYRILFVLNAEARNLLPTNPQTNYYKHYGIQKIKDRIRHEEGEFIGAKTVLYDALSTLFHLINGSNEKLNRDMNIPRYNGGLFDPEKYKFLEEKKVGDDVLSEVIYELSYRTDKNGDVHSIDYKGLGERHLGTVYEGLLEHKLVSDNGKVILKNDKGERKSTGAYYTPDYIVKYIVENTLGPLIKEIDKKIKFPLPSQEKDDSFAKEVLKLNICDPAMGSGHFLVEAVQYLVDEIAYHPTTQLKTQKEETEDEINYWKRKIVESCIYGVDIKELAVELAKLSLWLKTVDRSQPLNFLDHHLRCGNSLIGARVINLNHLPERRGKKKESNRQDEPPTLFDMSRFQRDITAVVKGFHKIEEMPSEKLSDIKAKENAFSKLMEDLNRYREIADLWTSLFFGNNLEQKGGEFKEIAPKIVPQIDLFREDEKINIDSQSPLPTRTKIYNTVVMTLQGNWGKEVFEKLKPLLSNSETIAKEKSFFHWELEFPEVFFNEDGSPKENPGFDCVIGNPPYDVLSELEQERDVEHEKEFFSCQMSYKPALGSKINFYRLFSVTSLNLLKSKGMHGFIVPMALLADKQAKPLREFILKKNCLQKVEAFPQKDDPANRVFYEAKLSTCIYILSKQKPFSFDVRIHPGKDIMETSTCLTIMPSQIEEFDKENLSIPCYPNMTAEDFKLALKLNRVSNGITLGYFAPSQQGEVNLTAHSEYLTDSEKGQIVLRGAHVNRYEFQEEPKQGTPMYLDIKRFLNTHGKDTKAFDYQHLRIGYQRGAAIDNWRRIIATVIERDSFCSDTINYIVNPKEYNLFAILSLLNSSLWEWRFRLTSTNNHVNSYEIDSMPMPPISFTTSEKERAKRVSEAVALYKDYMINLEHNRFEGALNEKTKNSEESYGTVEGDTYSRGKEKTIHREHTKSGKTIYGIRGRACKHKDIERVSEDSEEYRSTTRFIESSLGIKSYSELIPHLAKAVERVMAYLLNQKPYELIVTPEFIRKLHKDAFGELFPSWAGKYRDRDVTVGNYNPPLYFEVPALIQQYCDDLESRFNSLGIKPAATDILFESLAFAEGRFLSIHPFLDFNGRVVRMLLFALLYRLDLPPVQLIPDEKDEKGKEEYLKALSEANKFNWHPLIEIWKKRLGAKG